MPFMHTEFIKCCSCFLIHWNTQADVVWSCFSSGVCLGINPPCLSPPPPVQQFLGGFHDCLGHIWRQRDTNTGVHAHASAVRLKYHHAHLSNAGATQWLWMRSRLRAVPVIHVCYRVKPAVSSDALIDAFSFRVCTRKCGLSLAE